MTYITADNLKFLAAVVEWLESAPEHKLKYGDFYVSDVRFSFDSEKLSGRFVYSDEQWNYTEEAEES